jgi:lipoprotein-anchoring transpeptidase ErfK/SrfK
MTFGTSLTRRGALLGAGAAGLGLASACSSESGTIGGGSGGDADADEGPVSAATVAITPEDGDTQATAAAEISWTVEDGEFVEFRLTDASGGEVSGAMHPDGETWVPASPLSWDTAYTAAVTAVDADGVQVTAESTFTTIPSPGNRRGIHLYTPNGTLGQAAVIAFQFNDYYSVDESLRRDVERRLFVSSEPSQEGSWYWHNGYTLEYRPKEYWQPGTQVTVRLALGGLPIGDGVHGEVDVDQTLTIDTEKRILQADNNSKQLQAIRDDVVVNSFPISLGADEIDGNDARSYEGHMIIMSREEESNFVSDLYGYDTDVKWAMRLTWSGQYIHGAPWAANALGNRNISHGCINVTDEDGEWLYNFVRWGDPVVVSNTGKRLPQGDGITSWDLSWEQIQAGSYAAGDDQ